VKLSQMLLAPFEAAIAGIIVVQAVIALGGWGLVDPTSAHLPDWLAVAFNTAYLLAGLAILAGLILPRGDLEGAGLVLLSAVVLARSILFGQLLGWQLRAVTSVAFGLFVAAAALARIAVLRATSKGRPL